MLADEYSKNNTELIKVQRKLLKILIEVDKICTNHKLEYWLDAGTLLGAVRHEGFIPWDDDVDIIMPMEDYNRFIEIANRELPEHLYILEYNPQRKNLHEWIKVKDKTSIFIEDEKKEFDNHMYIDIFPFQKYACDDKKYKTLTRLHEMNKYTKYDYSIKTDEGYTTVSKIKNILKRYIKEVIYIATNNIVEKKIDKLESKIFTVEKYKVGYSLRSGYNIFHKKDDIYPLRKLTFEDCEFYCPNNFDNYLTRLYGKDYMELPPEENRVSHNIYIKASIEDDIYK